MKDRVITIVVEIGRNGELWARRVKPDGTLTAPVEIIDGDTRALLVGYEDEED